VHIDLNDTTFPKLLKQNAEKYGERRTALRQKGLGIWQPFSWLQYYENVRNLALGLHSLGLVAGDKLAIIGNNRPESLFSEIATQSIGGIAVSFYQDATPQEVAGSIQQYNVRFVIAEDQEQVDKILDYQEQLSGVQKVIYIQKRGMRNYKNEILTSFADTLEMGRELHEQHPALFNSFVDSGKSSDTAIICMTSGTTGEPKGAVLSFKNLISMSLAFNEADPKSENDEFVSLLPLAWFGEQLMSVAAPLVVGYTVNFPEKPETAMADMREIGPHIMLSPPKVWESIAATVRVRMMDSTPFNKFMFNSLMPIGEKYADCILSNSTPPASLKIARYFAHILLFRALKDRLGLSHIRSALTGGASLGTDVFRFFHAIGVNLKQLYGQTEIAGITCMHRDGGVNGSTVGIPLPGTEIKIDDNGEILSRSSGLFSGYYGDKESTDRVLTTDGWLRSGDTGYIHENGHLRVIDRISDILVLSDGSKYSAQFIENSLRFSPYISEALVHGGGSSQLVALIGINSRVVGKWAGDNKLSYMTFADLTAKDEVIGLIAGEVSRVNQSLSELARIARFAIIYKELDADEGELTRTGKMRRETVSTIYGELIEALHAGRDKVHIDTSIELPDGKVGHIQTTVTIRTA
jgi:long-chain acyl-CoA synthetase